MDLLLFEILIRHKDFSTLAIDSGTASQPKYCTLILEIGPAFVGQGLIDEEAPFFKKLLPKFRVLLIDVADTTLAFGRSGEEYYIAGFNDVTD